jgi:ATP-dependent helicase/nuclease subunit B
MSRQANARHARIDAWLAAGDTVLAANERAARAAASAHHAARQAEGRTAWITPAIFAWDSWVRDRWLERNRSGQVLLNSLQEQALWAQVIGKSPLVEGLLHPLRLASAAQEAYRLLCTYAPHALKAPARAGWSGDAAIFSQWLDEFESRCRRNGLVSGSRLALELASALQNEAATSHSGEKENSPLLLIGFDRLLETRQSLLNAWGEWQQDAPEETTSSPQFLAAPDAASEVAACVRWLRARLSLSQDPHARLLVVTTTLQQRRGQLERALLDASRLDNSNLDFEFSLGVPLGQLSLARSAILLLRWLHEPLSEPEVDWLIGSGHNATSADEEIALAETMRELRRCGQERPEWRLEDFAMAEKRSNTPSGREIARASSYAAWSSRLLSARNRLREIPTRQSPLEWIVIAGELLQTAGWPGFRPLSSVAFQAQERWRQLLEDCGSLGFDGSQIEWPDFVATIAEAASATIFAAESSDARIQITEPLESAGQLADGIWFLGANEENWPGRGQLHPLLPAGLQRETGMPHASPQADWGLAQVATHRLLASADEVIFSYASHSAEAEARPSRLVKRTVGDPIDLPDENSQPEAPRISARLDLSDIFEDASLVPYPHTEIGGGAAMLTRQSQCPFQAFVTARLNAEDWDPAEAGLTPKQRGQLLHAVLRQVWSGPSQGGISSLEDLQQIADLRQFLGKIVRSVMTESFDPLRRNSIPRRFPERYLGLEAERLTQLVSEWLEYERERLPFRVAETEARREVTVAGLKLTLRLDRIDELPNGGRLIIDYKSSEVGPKAWEGDRPDDVQLPLYATFAAPTDLEGLVFARLRLGKTQFHGRVRNATNSLLAGLGKQSSLVKNPLTDRQLDEWHDRIEQLGQDFLDGRADVDPKDPVKTCERCHLHAVCRIYENQPLAALADEDDERDENQESEGGLDA